MYECRAFIGPCGSHHPVCVRVCVCVCVCVCEYRTIIFAKKKKQPKSATTDQTNVNIVMCTTHIYMRMHAHTRAFPCHQHEMESLPQLIQSHSRWDLGGKIRLAHLTFADGSKLSNLFRIHRRPRAAMSAMPSHMMPDCKNRTSSERSFWTGWTVR